LIRPCFTVHVHLSSRPLLLLVLALRIHGNFPVDEGDGQKEKRQKDLTQEMERGWMGGCYFSFSKTCVIHKRDFFFQNKNKKKDVLDEPV
jgi:hypothetical protein